MEQALAAIHQSNPERLPIELEFRRYAGQVTLACNLPEELRATGETQFFAAYPDASLHEIEDERASGCTWTMLLRLEREVFPIRRYVQFEDALNRVVADPIGALLSVVSSRRESPIEPRIVIVLQPARTRQRRRAEKCLLVLSTPFLRKHHRLAHWYAHWALASSRWRRLIARLFAFGFGTPEHHAALAVSSGRQHDREEDLQAGADKLGRLLFDAWIVLSVSGPEEAQAEAHRKLREMAGAFGQFSSPRLAAFHPRSSHSRKSPPPFLLSTEEVATLWHPPTQTVRAPTMSSVESREMEPPVQLPTRSTHPDLAVIGMAVFRGRQQRFGILPDDRRRHVALVGKTGQGKTTLLQHLIGSDIRAGRGVGLIDAHGDLCDSVLAGIPRRRTNDVILFDAADAAHPLSFNLLHCPDLAQRPLVASGIVSAFKKLYAEFWGPRLEHILRNGILALLEIPGATLLTLLRLLGDAKFRQGIVPNVADPVVRNFWQREFASMPPKFQAEAVAPIYNKVGHFMSSPLLRHILGQSRNSLDLRETVDTNKVLLVNVSKGRLGDDASALLGSLLITALQLATMSRANVAESERPDFFLYVDEFQNFATESFATILSEARKYRMALTLANQYLSQLDEATADALFGNVGTLVSFQVGANDAETLAMQLGGDLVPQDLLQLPRYQAYVRLLIDGHPSRPFSMRTLPPTKILNPERAAIIRGTSRERFTRDLVEVEQEIESALAV